MLAARLRTALVLAACVAAAAGCAEGDYGRDASDPHPPADDEERALAVRYGDFARALERRDEGGICRDLARELTAAYRCGEAGRLRLPPELRRIEVPMRAVYAARDPIAENIQISSRAKRKRGQSLIVFYERGGSGWEVTRVMIGGYG